MVSVRGVALNLQHYLSLPHTGGRVRRLCHLPRVARTADRYHDDCLHAYALRWPNTKLSCPARRVCYG